jgi:hypothetical protein
VPGVVGVGVGVGVALIVGGEVGMGDVGEAGAKGGPDGERAAKGSWVCCERGQLDMEAISTRSRNMVMMMAQTRCALFKGSQK